MVVNSKGSKITLEYYQQNKFSTGNLYKPSSLDEYLNTSFLVSFKPLQV